MGWISATVGALAVMCLVTALIVPIIARSTLAAYRRWPRLSGWSPAVMLIVVVVTPILMGLAIGVGVFWPGVLGHVLHLCHCSTEVLDTGHTSVLHPEPSVSLLPYSFVLLVALLANPLRVLVSSYSAQAAARRAMPVKGETVPIAGTLVRLLSMGNANAFTGGFLRPKIYVDRRWWQSLSREERDIVAAHEHCHQRYFDPLVLLITRVLAAYLPADRAGKLLSLFALQMETRADRLAVQSNGDALTVAEFLLKAHREAAHLSPSLAFVSPSIERRIETLVDVADGRCDNGVTLAQWVSLATVSGMVVSTFVFRGIIHRTAEFILSLV